MQNKKVLIITDVFPPGFAPRMGYLCKYLKQYQWDAIVLAPLYDREQNAFAFLSGHVPFESIIISKEAEKSEYKRNIFQKILSAGFPKMLIPLKLRKQMIVKGEEIIRKTHVDIVLCSTSNFFPLHIAYKLIKKHDIPWIVDLRDIEEEYIYTMWSFFKKVRGKSIIRQRNYFIKQAKATIAVSKEHVKILSQWNPNTFLIYNGFDSDLFKYLPPKNCKQFRIVYTGTISADGVDRNPSMLFSIISRLEDEKNIEPDSFRVQFYADSKSHNIVNTLAFRFGISKYIDCFEYIPSSEVPEILHNASILLLLIQGKVGIMTTKLFEYLAVGRPILCIRSDEDAIESLLKELHAGLAARSEEDAYIFIKDKYNEWKQLGYTISMTNQEKIEIFSRKNQAEQFVKLFEQSIWNR